jgi:hypothetical protein
VRSCGPYVPARSMSAELRTSDSTRNDARARAGRALAPPAPHRDRPRAHDLEAVLAEALSLGRTAVVDVRVDQKEECYPMIPAGAAALEMVEYQDSEHKEVSA